MLNWSTGSYYNKEVLSLIGLRPGWFGWNVYKHDIMFWKYVKITIIIMVCKFMFQRHGKNSSRTSLCVYVMLSLVFIIISQPIQ